MGWSKIDRLLEEIREVLGENPEKARQMVDQQLEVTRSPSSRIRLWGARILACCRLGEFDEGLEACRRGRRIRGVSLARAELEWQAAELHVARDDAPRACRAVEASLSRLQPLLDDPSLAPRTAQHVRATYAATLLIRAEMTCHLEDDPRRALPDALEALRLADARRAARIHLSAVSVVAFLVTRPGVGNVDDLRLVLRLADQAQRYLRRRRIAARHPHRIKLRVIRALALARLGAGELAEQVLSGAVADLRERGLERDADLVARQLLWVVAERGGKWGRAQVLCRQLGLPPAQVVRRPRDDPRDPIGF